MHYDRALTSNPSLHTAPGLVPQLVGALGWRTGPARSLLVAYPSEEAVDALATRGATPWSAWPPIPTRGRWRP